MLSGDEVKKEFKDSYKEALLSALEYLESLQPTEEVPEPVTDPGSLGKLPSHSAIQQQAI